MFFSKLAAPLTEVEKMLLEQQETIKKADAIMAEVKKLKVKNMYDASNTLQNPIFDTGNNSFIQSAERFFSYMDTTVHYITHPILILNAVAGASYWICGIICIAGILYYIVGHEKGVKWAGGSLLGYTLIQIVNSAANLL